jgi:hypothetical protein
MVECVDSSLAPPHPLTESPTLRDVLFQPLKSAFLVTEASLPWLQNVWWNQLEKGIKVQVDIPGSPVV